MTKYRCPVCGEEFEAVGSADRHFDRHKPSEYVVTWEIEPEEDQA